MKQNLYTNGLLATFREGIKLLHKNLYLLTFHE